METELRVFLISTINRINPITPNMMRIEKPKIMGVCSRNENLRTMTRIEKPIKVSCRGRESCGNNHASGTDLPVTRHIAKKRIPQAVIFNKIMSGTIMRDSVCQENW